MNMKFSTAIIAFMLTSAFSSLASANSLGQFDARSIALGGTGVAGSKSANAAAYNPALLAVESNDKRFAFLFTPLNLSAFDENGFSDNIEDAEESINGDGGLDDLLDGMSGVDKEAACEAQNNPQPSTICYQHPNMQPTSVKAAEVESNVLALNKSNALINFNAGMAFQFGKNRPMAFIVDGGSNLRVGLKAAQSDFSELTAYTDKMADGAITYQDFIDLSSEGLVEEQNGQLEFTKSGGNGEQLQSMIEVLGAVYYEFGLSFADSFDYADRELAVGITPKIIKVGALKFHQTVEAEDIESDDVLDDDNITDKTDFNADVGVTFMPFEDKPMRVGFTLKNMFTRSYDLKKSTTELALENAASGTGEEAARAQADLAGFKFTQELAIEPQLTAGVAYDYGLINLMADLDLNEAEMLGRTTQHLGLGAEFDARFFRFQLGYRAAIGGDNEEDAVSGGLTLGPVDIAAVFAGDTYGAVLQTGFSF